MAPSLKGAFRPDLFEFFFMDLFKLFSICMCCYEFAYVVTIILTVRIRKERSSTDSDPCYIILTINY